MLFYIDKKCNNLPSRWLNTVTGGNKGETVCARLWRYQQQVSDTNIAVNLLIMVIDTLEKDHCRKAYLTFKRRTNNE
jgi:hypothetical protein